MKIHAINRAVLKAILSGGYTPFDLREFVQCCCDLALPVIRKKIILGKLNLDLIGLNEMDVVYDCLADLFQRDEQREFSQIASFFKGQLQDIEQCTDEELVMALRRLVIGGWVPYFLTQRSTGETPHQGSLDIDLAINPLSIPDDAYETILEILHQREYEPRRNANGEVIPASYIRIFTNHEGREHTVQVDLMSPEYGGTTSAHRHQPVQDILARKGRGVDLAFTSPVEKRLEGYLPNKAKNAVTLWIANVIACFTMKATLSHPWKGEGCIRSICADQRISEWHG